MNSIKFTACIFYLLFFMAFLDAQVVHSAYLSEDGTYSVEEHHNFPIKTSSSRLPYEQLNNFPFASQAHPAFKNLRNVSQADVNGDEIDEILFCANETLYALDGNGELVWSFDMEGTSNFPPAIGDLNSDDEIDIACQTYGIQPNVGNVYLFDKSGNLFPNYPFNSSNNFFLNGVTISNSSDGPFLIASERVSSIEGRIHLLTAEAESLNENFPVMLGGTPAITPSIEDWSNDPYLVLCSTTEMYLVNFDGEFINGSPFEVENAKFSYQSPLTLNVQDQSERHIVGAMHGDNANDYVIIGNGEALNNWPHSDNQWTYSTPSFIENMNSSEVEIYLNRPYVNEDNEGPILLGYNAEGDPLPNFPIMGNAGSEGLVTIGDIDGDGDLELLSPSKIMIDGKGMINAYHIETGDLVDGFPLFVPGFTFLNGAYLGDVNGDGNLDLTALSYQLKFDASSPDSCFINVFDMEVSYNKSTIRFNGYKGNTSHKGNYFNSFLGTETLAIIPIGISPNPGKAIINITTDSEIRNLPYTIQNMNGTIIKQGVIHNDFININDLPSGKYQLRITSDDKIFTNSFIKID